MNEDKIALLIDADNTQLQKLDAIMTEISTRGRIVVKRAYGNWKKRNLNKWENELKRLGIKAEQQFDYVSGKNATDMALVIDAMDLLSSNAFDSFVLVSSDSDFTPLAIRLHESGANIVGIGDERQEFAGAESFAQGHEPRDVVDAVVSVGDPGEDEQGQETEEDERAQQSGVETSAGDAFQRAVGESFKRCEEVDCFHVRPGPGWDRDAPTRGTGVCV